MEEIEEIEEGNGVRRGREECETEVREEEIGWYSAIQHSIA